MLQARCDKKNESLDLIDSYAELSDEHVEENGLKSRQTVEQYKFRTSASNLLGYLQVGSFEFANGVPFEIGDEISIEYIDSVKLQVVDVVKTGIGYKFLIGFYMPMSFSTCCYIISDRNSISGDYKLKCIGHDSYSSFTNSSVSDINTYVFHMID